MPEFRVVSDFEPTGDQPQAIEQLTDGLVQGFDHQVMRGITGSGKTYTVAKIIEAVQKPTLVVAHNKTLAAQLCAEFRQFFPENAVEFFVSYYDYYQPEAYLPSTDTFIEKDSQINDEIDRLRHSATQAVMERRDVLIVASVSCIFGLGSPDQYEEVTVELYKGQRVDRDDVLRDLVKIQFTRNNTALQRGSFRVRGDVIEICPMDEDRITRVEMFGDEVERIMVVDQVSGEIVEEKQRAVIFPATHFVASRQRVEGAVEVIQRELEERLAFFHRENMLLEAQRLEQRTLYDLEMITEVGYCQGIENYSRHFDERYAGEAPYTLLDYFPDDKLIVLDESHQTVPQIQAMYHGDLSRKLSLVQHGFRLPCALDNRPLTLPEWEERATQVLYTSATPAKYELARAKRVTELVIRPTGLIDPEVEVRPTQGQVDDLIGEIRTRAARGERILVTTLTKRMSEDLTDYLAEVDIRVHYLHSDIETMERTELLRDLRLGTYDVLVGINLLREGLDLPEVSLVAILDADREGFLRSETSLIQTMGRASRNVEGKVVMYADRITDSMRRAMDETERRRAKQVAYNEEHGITPQTIRKAVHDVIRSQEQMQEEVKKTVPSGIEGELAAADLDTLLTALEDEMASAAAALEFERAAELRDEIEMLRRKSGREEEA